MNDSILRRTVNGDSIHRMTVQLRIVELMKGAGYTTAYQLAQALAKDTRIGEATVYRLVRSGGKVDSIRADTLDALADHFGVEVADLFKRKRGK